MLNKFIQRISKFFLFLLLSIWIHISGGRISLTHLFLEIRMATSTVTNPSTLSPLELIDKCIGSKLWIIMKSMFLTLNFNWVNFRWEGDCRHSCWIWWVCEHGFRRRCWVRKHSRRPTHHKVGHDSSQWQSHFYASPGWRGSWNLTIVGFLQGKSERADFVSLMWINLFIGSLCFVDGFMVVQM